MPVCEMCGNDTFLLRAVVEGTELNVCKGCARFGKIIKRPFKKNYKKERPVINEENKKIPIVVSNYSALIKQAREKMGLKQEELAKRISEKESLLHHMESGEFEPSITLAKKLEKFLKISLIEEYEEKKDFVPKSKGKEVTIGDLIKIKKR